MRVASCWSAPGSRTANSLPAVAAQAVGLPAQLLADQQRQPGQAGIAGGVTILVVEQLEMVHVHHQQRQRLPARSGGGPALCQIALQPTAVGHPGQPVGGGYGTEPVVDARQFFGAQTLVQCQQETGRRSPASMAALA